MRAVLWDLLLLCLFARARGDCRGDCLRCDRHLYRDSFDVLVSPFSPVGAVPTASPPYWVATLLPAPGLGFWVGGGLWLPVGMEPQGEGVTCRHCPSSLGTPQGRHRTRWGVQKRYGGFIGVRKSARKWNNQKRFSEFLKQYLGMSPRSSEYDIAGGISEHNEI
uniref:PNOC protein n=1 Tax=Buteo japonicus TaxID=224669 RepID=A0A8B9YZA6_9AVES